VKGEHIGLVLLHFGPVLRLGVSEVGEDRMRHPIEIDLDLIGGRIARLPDFGELAHLPAHPRQAIVHHEEGDRRHREHDRENSDDLQGDR
jgi:hypothetical protein